MNLNKGAMFGLDARIALAIFGALSVISGAALYSAIQQSKVVSLITEAQEIAKANEAYLLDTGVYITSPSSSSNLRTGDLIVNPGVDGWKGPYLSYEDGPTANVTFDHPVYGNIQIIRARNTDWASWASSEYRCLKADAGSCVLGILVTSVPDSILKAIEENIDGSAPTGNEEFTGRFRFTSTGNAVFMGPIYDKSQAFD
tara:strand:+ start:70 stop:669 length:600 start_codon:yes stop_codon:yes gene_type:complete